MDSHKDNSSENEVETIYVGPNDVSKANDGNCANGGSSDVTSEPKVSTDYVLKQLMKQNEMLMNLLSLQASNTKNEPKIIPVLPDLNKSLPSFAGKSNNDDALDWLDTVNNIASLHKWPDNLKIETARACLEGPAKQWFIGRVFNSWSDFETQFKRTFATQSNIGSRWKTLVARVQNKNENVLDYYHEKVRLCRNLNLGIEDIKEQVMIGVSSKELCQYLLSRDHLNEDSLLSDIINFERMKEYRLQQNNKISNKLGLDKEVSNPSDCNKVKAVKKCTNCGGRYHVAEECRKPKRETGSCFLCGSMDHKKPDCPKRSASTWKANKARETDKSTMSTMLVENVPVAAVQKVVGVIFSENTEVKLNAILDSGSGISLIKENIVPLGVKYNPQFVNNFVGINNVKLDILGVIKANLIIGENNLTLDFHVVSNNTMVNECLLGRNFLLNQTITVIFDNGEVLIKQKELCSENQFIADEIMLIGENGLFDETDGKYELKIESENDYEVKIKLYDLFEECYVKPLRPSEPKVDFEMTINIKPNNEPFYFRPRKFSYYEKQKVEIMIDELLKNKIIQKSYSPYSSPIVLVKKKTGDLRLCVDYRELNKITLKDNFPLPRIEDQIDKLRDKYYFTKLDLKNAFHHVKLNKESIRLTSFVTHSGQYEYLRMPFGLKNSPPVFMRYINLIFKDLIESDEILIYIDDIMIATRDIQSHFYILQKVLKLCVDNLLVLRLDKCTFLYKTISYLGYIISGEGIQPDISNIKAIQDFPLPKTTKELHSFVGLASYFRKFIKDFSLIAKPLYELLKKNTTFVFGPKEIDTFNHLKHLLISPPILSIYSPVLETQLHCDASSHGYGSILMQKQSDGKFHPVAHFSKRTTPTESNYHSFELEMLAIVYSLQRFRVYLQGIEFKIVTDCNSLKLALSKKEINTKILRWSFILQEYTYTLEHRSNTKMRHVDALSRVHNVLVIEENSFERNLSIVQDRDEAISKIRIELEKNNSKWFEMRDGLVYRKEKKGLLFYVPRSMEQNVIRTCHDELGHLGIDKTITALTKTYWFPEMRSKVKTYIDNCMKCIVYSPVSGKAEGFLHNIPKRNEPFYTIHIDHCTLEKTRLKNKYLLVIIDGFSKFIKLNACKTTNSKEVIRYLKQYFQTYSRPKRIIADRGTAFTSNMFKEFVELNDIELSLIASGVPRANGQVERANRTIIPILAKLSPSPDRWDQVLAAAEFAVNNSVCRSTGKTPSELLFGIRQKGIINDLVKEYLDIGGDGCRNMEEMRNSAAEQIEKCQENNKKYYDKKHKAAKLYKKGDYVMLENNDVTPGVNKKLIPNYRGPYIVNKPLGNDRYVISDIEGFQITQRPFKGIFDASRMKLWFYCQEVEN